MAPVPIDLSDAITAGANTLGTLIGGAVSQGYNRENMALQNEYAKDLMNYQWQNFGSYEAQVKSMQKAGLNPAVLYGKSAPSAASPSPAMPSSAPINVPSVFDLSSLSNYMLSVAQAKKAGMDTKLSEQDIKNKEVDRQRDEFELELRKQFGKDIQTAELASSYMKLVLAADTADLNEQEKALNEWKIASEKAVSQANEHNRDILKQNLDNNPTKLRLENRLTELQGSAAAAQAAESSARARTEDVLRSGRKLALDLSNELQGLENDFNYETYQKRLEQFASQVGIIKWSVLTSEMEYKDRNAYHALQRLMLGKGSKQDGVDVFKFLRNYSTEKFDLKDLR